MITMEDFIPEDDPILRKQAEKVSFPIDEETKAKALEMRQFLINSQDEEMAETYNLRAGVGVAAPQLGISKQYTVLYIVNVDEEGNPGEVLLDEMLFNPRIISHSVGRAALNEGEGCLSVRRDVPGLVPRPKRVKIEYQDIDGNLQTLRLKDYLAIVVQHEIDHLKGILFYDHINEINPWEQDEDVTLL